MEKQIQKCPVCGKPLTQEEYDKALGIWKAKHEEIKHLEKERADLKHQAALLKKEKGDQEIKRLREQMEKGITPQIEGLLEEDKLLAKLRELFPHDQFDHPGKGGDIIQTVMEQSRVVGKIVYECKKVKSFSQSHVQQAANAREFRQANFAVLVTNAFPAKRQSYFVSNTVFVISPVNVEPVTYVSRQSLVKIALLKLSDAEKMRAVNEVYKYLAGNEYSDKVNGVAYQLVALAGDLKSEIHAHHQTWKKRYSIYKNLYTDIGIIDLRLKTFLALKDGKEPPRLIAGQQNTYPLLEELEKK